MEQRCGNGTAGVRRRGRRETGGEGRGEGVRRGAGEDGGEDREGGEGMGRGGGGGGGWVVLRRIIPSLVEKIVRRDEPLWLKQLLPSEESEK